MYSLCFKKCSSQGLNSVFLSCPPARTGLFPCWTLAPWLWQWSLQSLWCSVLLYLFSCSGLGGSVPVMWKMWAIVSKFLQGSASYCFQRLPDELRQSFCTMGWKMWFRKHISWMRRECEGGQLSEVLEGQAWIREFIAFFFFFKP